MIPVSKLNFAAWTGLGITALFGGTGIYLVRNSKNLGRTKDEKEQAKTSLEEAQEVSDPNLSLETGPAPQTPDEERQEEQDKAGENSLQVEDNQEQDSELENANLSQEEQESDSLPEEQGNSEDADLSDLEEPAIEDSDPSSKKNQEDLPQTQPEKENLDQNPVSPQVGRRDFIFHEENETFEEITER